MTDVEYRATGHDILNRLIEEYDNPEAENWRRILGYFIDAADLDLVAAWAIRDLVAGRFKERA
jgi:hypothetical protein